MKSIVKQIKEGKGGFTLIELLIVVAIIAILAAIAVPNFLEAQTRSKVTRAKSDHRTLATAIESYRVDHTMYPVQNGSMDSPNGLIRLSTPVSYMSNPLLVDPFKPQGDVSTNNNVGQNQYIYSFIKRSPLVPGIGGMPAKFTLSRGAFPLVNGFDLTSDEKFKAGPYSWLLCSYGPDKALQFDNDPAITSGDRNCYKPYDTTNGTRSAGDIFRFGP